MDNNLLTISKIFTEKLFRIPDYQRGFAWEKKHIKDFWNDLIQLEDAKNHYFGVLTVERVSERIFNSWNDDKWIILSKSFDPYYVVDGQQRITTIVILLQAIYERLNDDGVLNFTNGAEIKKKYLFDTKDNGISKSFIFGYERDNPSYKCLKELILTNNTEREKIEETIYTQNLENAKLFFTEEVTKLSQDDLEIIFKKLTQNLLFNIYTISEDIDVQVSFETMNNRGKPLSHLELLKNRLIFITTKFKEIQTEKDAIRKKINDCWKLVYHYLGKNKDNPLDDDLFLLTHFILYFNIRLFKDTGIDNIRFRRIRYIRTMHSNITLDKIFILKHVSISNRSSKEKPITISYINKYISSLSRAVKCWFAILNPLDSDLLSAEAKHWMETINRINSRGIEAHYSLILIFIMNEKDDSLRIDFLKELDKHLFFSTLTDHYYSSDLKPFQLSIDLFNKEISSTQIITEIKKYNTLLSHDDDFKKSMVKHFSSYGYYNWDGIHYFLYEYELMLKKKTKAHRMKINWQTFHECPEDHITIEHIFPQKATNAYWKKYYKGFTPHRKKKLRNSLGNLLPLSQPKNSSLGNKSFPDKIDGNPEKKIGYRYGSISENEITINENWTHIEILKRGIDLLNFLEKRWSIKIGDDEIKKEMLGLSFLK